MSRIPALHSLAPVLAAAALLCSTASPARAEIPRCARSDAWVQAETPRFVVYSNGGTRTAVRVARQLERLAEVMAMTTTGLSVKSPRPMPVYAFKDDDSFSYYKRNRDGKPENLSGYYVTSPEGGMIALNASVTDEHRQVVFHEYTHALLHRSLTRVPLWLDEGLAEFFSACRLGADYAETGKPIPQHLAFLATRELMELDVLFGTDHDAPGYHEGERQGMIYAQSWALTHYLMRGMDDGGKRFANFFSRVADGAKPYDAFFTAYEGIGLDAIRNGLREYVRRGEYSVMSYRFTENLDAVPVRSREMSRPEVLARLGDLLASRTPGTEAIEHLYLALPVDSLRAGAAALIGIIEEQRGDTTAANRAYEQSVQAPRTPRSDRIVARGLIHRFLGAVRPAELGPTPPPLARARVRLESSLAAEPDDPEALALLGKTYLMDRENPVEGIRVLMDAAAAMPRRGDVLVDLVTLYANGGHRAAARRILAQSLEPIADVDEMRRAERAIVFADLREHRALSQAGKRAAAESLLARARTEILDPDLRRHLDEMARVDAGNRAVALYNQGIEALNGQRPRQALPSFEQARDQTTDPELRKSAVARLAEARLLIRIDDALALVRKGRVSEARAILTEVTRGDPPKEIREYAEGILRDLGGR